MTDIGRKSLPHETPLWVDPPRRVFFLTICAADRRGAPLLPVASRLLEAVRFLHTQRKWSVHLAVVMPDHVHLVVRFPAEDSLTAVVRGWKRWTARTLSVSWQRDFFEHRLRSEDSAREKVDYVLQNPVRAGLVADWRAWPHGWMSDELLTLAR
jgi:REP element-mobilizing transposase RayT